MDWELLIADCVARPLGKALTRAFALACLCVALAGMGGYWLGWYRTDRDWQRRYAQLNQEKSENEAAFAMLNDRWKQICKEANDRAAMWLKQRNECLDAKGR